MSQITFGSFFILAVLFLVVSCSSVQRQPATVKIRGLNGKWTAHHLRVKALLAKTDNLGKSVQVKKYDIY
ncbi:hypothetical protein HBN50_13155 [Halobacteriovorax sp. GB3]|uniref:hypothetical protein n=1 Tax=Halobacteriovorax sp. GB3 TaxID=2719615 RepID=UPI0023608E14|nr:hypothetical protein [Halobacteriovorax sp. GB3]MDD0854054.1 hypothetical protein [Halobacteriovorax sp. GB3]